VVADHGEPGALAQHRLEGIHVNVAVQIVAQAKIIAVIAEVNNRVDNTILAVGLEKKMYIESTCGK
jgi:hypothetical protein